jgi:hypothetical protein
MTDLHDRQLEEQLSSLTTWEGSSSELWREALARAKAGSATSSSGSGVTRLLHTRVPNWFIAMAAGFAVLVTLQLLFVPSLGLGTRDSEAQPTSVFQAVVPTDTSGGEGGFGGSNAAARNLRGGVALRYGQSVDDSSSVGPPPPPPAERQVVRKATVELVTADVRATFLKASLLVSEARGEFIEESSLAGADENEKAHVELRVAADRLSEVLNQLRELGEVVSEQSSGEDITTQVVDLEARLRNEQSVEKELLELLAKREDAPLKDVLELRRHIASVREQIERLTAQRTRLDRLVALATVLVLIRADDAPPEEAETEESLGSYFSENTQAAWRNGLLFLADTLALLLRVLVGGVIWWVLLILVVLRLWQVRRRAAGA